MTTDDDRDPVALDTALQRAVHAVLRGELHELLRRELSDEERRLVDDLTPWLHAWSASTEAPGAKAPEPGRLAQDASAAQVPMWTALRDDDPVAQMLGLIPTDTSWVSPQRLTSARRSAGLSLQDFVSRINQRGWNIEVSQAFRWERTATPLAPALLEVLARTLRVDVTFLAEPAAAAPDVFSEDRIRQVLAEWADDAGWNLEALTTRVRATLSTAAQRNAGQPNVSALLAILRQLRTTPGFLEPS